MNSDSLRRILLGIILFAGVFILPYWLIVPLAAITALFIPYYVEFVALVVFEEMLYAGAGSAPSSMTIPILLVLFFIVVELGRGVVRERILRI